MKKRKFKDIYLEYLNYIESRLKAQSKRSIKNRFQHIYPYFENKDIFKINQNDIISWQGIINQKGFSFKYKSGLHITLVTFLNYCIRFHGLKVNYASKVGNFRNVEINLRHYEYYTLDQFNKFISCFDDDVYKYFFEFMYFTGVRPGEARALKFSDVIGSYVSINKTLDSRFYNNELIENSVKTKSSNRIIMIDDFILNRINYLRKYYSKLYDTNNIDDLRVFGGKKYLSTTTCDRRSIKASEIAHLRHIRLHDFRHSHATLLLDNNVNIKAISCRLGHANTSVTLNTYVHVNFETEKRVFNTLNSLH